MARTQTEEDEYRESLLGHFDSLQTDVIMLVDLAVAEGEARERHHAKPDDQELTENFYASWAARLNATLSLIKRLDENHHRK